MSKKKILRKNEVRDDLNPLHKNKRNETHKALITARDGHFYMANTLTHSEYVNGVKTYDLKNGKGSRLSPPFWQKDKQFGKKNYGKIPKRIKSKISRYNRKFKKK